MESSAIQTRISEQFPLVYQSEVYATKNNENKQPNIKLKSSKPIKLIKFVAIKIDLICVVKLSMTNSLTSTDL